MPAKTIGSPRTPIVAVVDDDEAVREALSDLLLVLGLACRTFDRAEAFMSVCGPDHFDCLITDVSMPGRSGLELQERLRELGSPMPVIIITADTSPATRARALTGGALACLTKPVSDDVLLYLLKSALKPTDGSCDDDRTGTSPDE